jgi:hypothetical protein
MSDFNAEIRQLGKTWVEVDPVNHVMRGSSDRHDEYTFSRIYVDDVDPERLDLPTGSEVGMPEDGIVLYQYNDRDTILITQDGAYVQQGYVSDMAEKQAYFALSLLDEAGYVGNWRSV